jgi:uncharacterized repeat protein (TIGR03803 family)
MRICVKNHLPVLAAGLGLVLAARAATQTFTVLYSFTAYADTNGSSPNGLTLSGSNLYGTAARGGTTADGVPAGYGGTVFAINADGTGFSTLHSFLGTIGYPPPDRNPDGLFPNGLLVSGNTMYGTTTGGGSSGSGTVFAVNTNGTAFTTLHTFTALLNTNSTGAYTNSDGVGPQAGLVLSGTTLFGTTSAGGSSGSGTVFAINTSGTGFTTLHSFAALTNTCGGCTLCPVWPSIGLTLSGGMLYGTTPFGGVSGSGTAFKLSTNGTDFKTLHDFSAGGCAVLIAPWCGSVFTNSDGAHPDAGLILWGNTLYGTTSDGGTWGNGTVFAINIDGTGFKTLHDFSAVSTNISLDFTNNDGANPAARLVVSGNTLYGTAFQGGISGNGTIFSISLLPQLTITSLGENVVLAWPTNFTGYTLQSTANRVSPALWTAVSVGPIVVDGQNTLTNPISGIQRFYRLSQ